MRDIGRLIDRLETATMVVAAATLFLVMMIVVVDVVLRYLWRSPLSWSYDLISLYLMPAIFLLALSHTYREQKHINVELFADRVPGGWWKAAQAIGRLLSLAVFAMIVQQGVVRSFASWEKGDVLGGAIAWPTWVSQVLVPVGFGLLMLRLVFDVVEGVYRSVHPEAPSATVPASGRRIDPEERI